MPILISTVRDSSNTMSRDQQKW